MAAIINASTSSGLIQTADTSGILTFQSNGTSAASVSGSNLQFNSGYGSVATAYGCRAWVNFDGTGTPAIRASGNVSSITDNGTGDYTVNFTTAMPDANYAVACSQLGATANVIVNGEGNVAPATTSLRVGARATATSTLTDASYITVAIFR
jgi:hypothetical protein